MKKTLLSTLLFCCTAILFAMYSCKPDVCKDVVCAHSGTCVLGKCACQVGYEGLHCETLMRDKFIGDWQVQEDGTLSAAALYPTSIEAGAVVNQVKIHNLQNGFTAPVIATVKADTITIATQSVAHGATNSTVVGYGFIKGTNPLDQHYYQHATVTFYYVITNSIGQVNEYGSGGSLPSNWSK
jgi:hypothetical protein